MKALIRKTIRQGLQRRITARFNKQAPNFDQYVSRHRFPLLPKIVVYSNIQSPQNYLDQIFPLYKYVVPNATAQSDQLMTRRVAEQLLTPTDQSFNGFLIKGFPFNSHQALLLDRYLNGVNLAIHLCDSKDAEYQKSVGELLNYYNERGTLLRLPYSSTPNADQLQWASRQILSHIKTSD